MNKRTVAKMISVRLEKEIAEHDTHLRIREILAPLEGKPVNHVTLSEKRLQGFKLEKDRVGLGSFNIIGPATEHGHNIKEGDICLKSFRDSDSPYSKGAPERIEKLKALDPEVVAKTFKKIRRNFEELRLLFGDVESLGLGSFDNPIYYDLIKLAACDAEEKHIKLNDFYYIRKNR